MFIRELTFASKDAGLFPEHFGVLFPLANARKVFVNFVWLVFLQTFVFFVYVYFTFVHGIFLNFTDSKIMANVVHVQGLPPLDLSDPGVLNWLVTWPGIAQLPLDHPIVLARNQHLLDLTQQYSFSALNFPQTQAVNIPPPVVNNPPPVVNNPPPVVNNPPPVDPNLPSTSAGHRSMDHFNPHAAAARFFGFEDEEDSSEDEHDPLLDDAGFSRPRTAVDAESESGDTMRSESAPPFVLSMPE